jgi:hypothetical protein
MAPQGKFVPRELGGDAVVAAQRFLIFPREFVRADVNNPG